MVLLKILFYGLLIYLGLRVFFTLFGPMLGRWVMLSFVRKVQEQAERQANARARTSAPYEKEFYVAPDLKATVQPRAPREVRSNDLSRLADSDVEFEELPEKPGDATRT